MSPFKTSGIRIGAAAITARGFGEEESRKVAELIIKTLKNAENEAVLEEVRSAVKRIDRCLPIIRGLKLLWIFILRKLLFISLAG